MRIIIASHNEKKIKEIKEFLKCNNVYSLKNVGYEKDILEFGKTFEQNALIKVQEIEKEFPNDLIISEDSGLCVEYLNGNPGVFSKRYAQTENGYKEDLNHANNLKLIEALKGVDNRNAFFKTCFCIIIPKQLPIFIEGKVEGKISREYEKSDAFGYDPIFRYKDKLFSELTVKQKNKVSHRGRALAELKVLLKEQKII